MEAIPGKVSWVLLLKGTWMPVQAIIDNLDDGMTTRGIAEAEGLDPDSDLRRDHCARPASFAVHFALLLATRGRERL